jgi:hypothetical protein
MKCASKKKKGKKTQKSKPQNRPRSRPKSRSGTRSKSKSGPKSRSKSRSKNVSNLSSSLAGLTSDELDQRLSSEIGKGSKMSQDLYKMEIDEMNQEHQQRMINIENSKREFEKKLMKSNSKKKKLTKSQQDKRRKKIRRGRELRADLDLLTLTRRHLVNALKKDENNKDLNEKLVITDKMIEERQGQIQKQNQIGGRARRTKRNTRKRTRRR